MVVLKNQLPMQVPMQVLPIQKPMQVLPMEKSQLKPKPSEEDDYKSEKTQLFFSMLRLYRSKYIVDGTIKVFVITLKYTHNVFK